jgi:DNA replication protein DnaC
LAQAIGQAAIQQGCRALYRETRILLEELADAVNRPVEDWGKLLGDAAAVGAALDRLLHHRRALKRGPRSWRTKLDPLSAGAKQ